MGLDGWFLWFILFWVVILVSLMGIGGFFMFRKFLKALPKQDGKSDLDWQNIYLDKTIDMWGVEEKELLRELVSPVPELFRQVAKEKIAGKIGELAIEEKATKISLDLIIRGYIIASPKRDHKFLRKKMNQMEIDTKPYEHLFEA
ncbi:DUF2621 domain-containing protein [Lysinibacillus sp. 2017]|uniref:DUF2621 family protein n=1 Tax=unclassified Lysinibacillus TaxID=2636778 RepID=UPI000D528F65|nr:MULTISPECIES: DUF2621 family protein [unclassified Lysinibacillus]AWE07757.1 DUF2621 domain-containing protein [Lysinibacillus sp. 2017]TGN32337.1 DUF2621 domain-containing protein [Lysinibacillus sp. S2017]